jgi:F420-non-reducing hydrogenase iron-sulfur subunit
MNNVPGTPANTTSSGERAVIAFVCENCGRSGLSPSSGIRPRPTTPDFAWPIPVSQVAVPCAGRLQPEHFLKAFENGADAVAVVCCEEGSCHHLEGNTRCHRRLDYVGAMLKDLGLGANRLRIFSLPGSAAADMALGADQGSIAQPLLASEMARKIIEIREAFLTNLATIPQSPLRKKTTPQKNS